MRRYRNLARVAAALGAIALLPHAASGQYFTTFGKNKVQYKKFEWKIYNSTHFNIHYYPAEEHLLSKVVSFAESGYDQLSRELDHQIPDPINLIFYETHAAFEQTNVILNFIPEGVGAFAVPIKNRMVMPVDLDDAELMALMLHELTHVFQYDMLLRGSTTKALAFRVPTWFSEGMASYFASDESARDKAFLRDAVVNDRLPSVATNFGGFFGYRYGHAVFEFIEDQWGKDGVRDFLLEIEGGLGGSVPRAIERSFQLHPEDFDADFRRWLRRKYLPELVETGEPGDFGRPFRRTRTIFNGQMVSPAASPSGDLVAAFSTHKGDVDVVLFDAQKRTLLRNLTKGFDNEFEYLVAQEFTLGRHRGRDLAFSPDGNQIALFARHGEGRALVLLNVLKGGVDQVIDLVDKGVSQPYSPAWNPNGQSVVFSAYRGGQFDILSLDLNTEEVSNVTNDDVYDASPTYSPDGESLVLTSVVGGFGKLFRIDVDNPTERIPLTVGDSNDTDATYSPDGQRLYFTSDRTGADNIYSMDVASGDLQQHTNAITSGFQPTVLRGERGDRVVYAGYWKGRFDIYRLDTVEPITEPTIIDQPAAASEGVLSSDELARFEPSIEVPIDDENVGDYRPFRFFLENASANVGVSDDNTVIGQTILQFSNFLGDRRIIALLQSVEGFQNFDAAYVDLSKRWQRQLRIFDDEDFFTGFDAVGEFRRGRSAYQRTGIRASLIYPFGTSHRFEVGAGYEFRDINFQSFDRVDPTTVDLDVILELFPALAGLNLQDLPPDELNQQLQNLFPNGFSLPIIEPREDDYPVLEAGLVGDTAVFTQWGPISGRRWRLFTSWAPDTDDSGTLTSQFTGDWRQYLKVTPRSNLAVRLYGSFREGNFTTPGAIGGLDTIRGFDFRSLAGDRVFFGNLEFRFPLIDALATPVLRFGGIRGVIFLDVGGAWYDEFQDFEFWDSDNDRLGDAVASYGYGFTVNLFGFDWNFDFAKRTDFDESGDSFESSLWIGRRF